MLFLTDRFPRVLAVVALGARGALVIVLEGEVTIELNFSSVIPNSDSVFG